MGMSWPLGWTEQQTLDTTIPAIEIAYNGSQKMLRNVVEAVAGVPDAEPDVPTAPASMPSNDIMGIFRSLAS